MLCFFVVRTPVSVGFASAAYVHDLFVNVCAYFRCWRPCGFCFGLAISMLAAAMVLALMLPRSSSSSIAL